MNIFRSVENVNLNTVIAYKDDNGTHSFLDDYKNKQKGGQYENCACTNDNVLGYGRKS